MDEHEILSVIETLLEFRNILLGSKIVVCADHMNNVNLVIQHASKRMQHQRWLREEFGPKFRYLQRPSNYLVDALSRLDTAQLVAEGLSNLTINQATCYVNNIVLHD